MPVLTRVIIIAFLIVAIITFLLSGIERNYYNIRVSTYSELYLQLIMFFVLVLIMMIFNWEKYLNHLSLMICFFLLLFLLLFTIYAPVFSLAVGASVFAIPVMYFSFSNLILLRRENLNFEKAMAFINILVFIAIVIMTVVKWYLPYTEFSGLNLSKISDGPIITEDRSIFMNMSIATMITILFVFLFVRKGRIPGRYNRLVKWMTIVIVAGLLAFQITYLSLAMVYRTKAILTPTYDFGLFTQMFYNMSHFNGMVTTLERSVLMTHMAVHVSPIYYLILPVFMIFPYPETLQVVQVLIVACGLIPLYLIAKKFKFSTLVTGLVMVIYIFHPALISSSFFDLHENCFLAPLLLFVLYFVITQNSLGLMISATLTMLVKEDASIYLIFIGFYTIFGHGSTISDPNEKKLNLQYGISMIVFSTLYFLIVTTLLEQTGTGAMFWRYNNLNAHSELGAIGIIISLFQDPSYLLATMFTPDRMYYLLVILFMMGMLPLLSKTLANYFLVAPMVIFNFAATYLYQYQFGYQYYYGTTVLMIFMVVLVIKDKIKEEEHVQVFKKKSAIWFVTPLIMLVIFGISYLGLKAENYDDYFRYQEMNDSMKETLTSIPQDKKVLATIHLTTYLADREVLYDIQFYEIDTSDIVLD